MSPRRLSVLLYGEPSKPGSGAWCYAETLREMGHAVTTFDDGEHMQLYRSSLVARAYQKLARTPLEVHRRRHVTALLGRVAQERPEIIIILKGLHLGADDVRALKQLGPWVVNVNHDDFFSLNRHNWSSRQREALPQYDSVFTTREVNVDEVRPFNPRVEFFPFAYYPRIHRPVAIPEEERLKWSADVVFVGTWERERAAVLAALVQAVPAHYAIWGSQWNRLSYRSPLRKYVRGGEIVLDDMAKALGGAKMALGFLRKENRDDYTQRTFEIPACGGLLLAERTERHRAFFREGAEAVFFELGSAIDLARNVNRLLSFDDRSREEIRDAGRAAVLRQGQTYHHRLVRLLEAYAAAQEGVPPMDRIPARPLFKEGLVR